MVDGHIVAFLLNLCKLSWWLRYRPSLLLLVFSFALVKAVSCLCRHRWFYNCVEPNGREQRKTALQRRRGSDPIPACCAVVLSWSLPLSSVRLTALLWLDPILQPSRVRHSMASQHGLTGAMCQETANGEAPRNEPSNSWVPCPLTWATARLAAWWPSGLVGVLCASVIYTPRVLSLPKR